MTVSDNILKNICRDYITIDQKGVINFKSLLEINILNNSISQDEALFFLLDLLFLANHGLEYEFISKRLSYVINEFNNGNDSKLMKTIFNRLYFNEWNIVSDYILSLAQKKNLQHSLSKKSKNHKKLVKTILNDFTRDDLCYILDIDPNLNFERERVLKNRISKELLEISFDLDKLNDCSRDTIKRILSFNVKDSLTNEELIKIQNDYLYKVIDELEEKQKNQLKKVIEQKRLENERILNYLIPNVKSFNNKSFSEMVSLEGEYSKIYDEILNNRFEFSSFEEISLFENYYSHLDDIKQIITIENEIERQQSLLNQFNKDLEYSGFLNYSKREKIINQYESLYELTSKLDDFPIFLKDKLFQQFSNLKNFVEYYEDLKNYSNLSDEKPNKIKTLNEKALDDEINGNEDFFKDMTDINKKRAIVLDEKNVKVNAGAGTGKTFTIQNKVNYLIEKKGVSPNKILCLCYTIAGANDLDKKLNNNREEDKKVEACTFHEFCRRVARKCGINKGKTDRKILDNIIHNYSKEWIDDDKLIKLTDYFSYYINSPADKENISNYDELLAYEKGRDLKTLKMKFYESGNNIRTMKGEIVDSIGELMIANYLFMHEIEYVYGMEYKSNLIDLLQNRFLYSGKSFSLNTLDNEKEWIEKFISEYSWPSYVPDFYLPNNDIYLEHFGIGHVDNEKWLGKDYVPQIKRKKEYHELHQTTLINTYYCYLEDGVLLEKLEEILEKNKVTIGKKNPQEILDVLESTNKIEDFDNFNKLIKNFINIFEAQNHLKEKFDLLKKNNEKESDGYKRNRQKLFLDIVSDIYDIYYESNEGERIDNNREVSLALELILTNKYSGDYDYILIDEYQDINPIRSLLLQSLQKITDAKLFVVGDDWQSIYMFNGSDLNLFIDFDSYFPNSEFIKLQENRRNYEKINSIASKFIMENEKQEKKELKSIKSKSDLNPIQIVYYSPFSKNNKVFKLYLIISDIVKRNPKSRILLLGRNNNDIVEFTNNNAIFTSFPNSDKVVCLQNTKLDITFKSIHGSKGLEYDDVIILNFRDRLNGFPNQIEDDSILGLLKEKEEYPFAEERRLLYVALTRTLNNVYLLSPNKDKSIFLEELVDKHKVPVLSLPLDEKLIRKLNKPKAPRRRFDKRKTNVDCPNCEDGKITVVRNNYTGKMYIRCSNHPIPNPSHYSGGPYWGDLENYIFIEKCPDPNCKGVLIRDFDSDYLICSLNRQGCKETKKINFDDYEF